MSYTKKNYSGNIFPSDNQGFNLGVRKCLKLATYCGYVYNNIFLININVENLNVIWKNYFMYDKHTHGKEKFLK